MPPERMEAPMFLERAVEAPAPKPKAASRRRKRAPSDDLWRPKMLGIAPRASDRYVVIDDLVAEGSDSVVVLAISGWPSLDALGRLSFPPPDRRTERLRADPTTLHEKVVAARTKRKEAPTLAGRPLRIGDAFFIRGLVRRPLRWSQLVDVSAEARERAKIALYGAAAARLKPTAATKRAVSMRPAPARRAPGAGAARPDL